VSGIIDLVAVARTRILSGMQAYAALQRLRANACRSGNAPAREQFLAHRADLGYGLLLLRYQSRIRPEATAAQIEARGGIDGA
jgi:cytochrome d ubiquinol oxidase subunit I